MTYKLGVIGAGNMAKAIVKGIIASGIISATDIIASARSQSTLDLVSSSLGIDTTLDNQKVVRESSYILLAVKPYMIESVLKDVITCLSGEQTLISIAAGVTLEQLESMTGGSIKLYRAMPNTPATVNEGMTSLCTTLSQSLSSSKFVYEIFSSIGKCEWISEAHIHAAIAVHGSSPAYAYMMIEAMGDAGVLLGLSREQSYRMAAQSLLGAAKMVLESDLHPGALKDQVTSPGGTTIEAVAALEKGGFRSSLIEAMKHCAEKSIEMSKP